ncbi:MAG TPA: bifunctional oligoribonuclease/PAP phosphatase NrnA [Firmicutes bacterium]|jgi:phosphoesterase RecJ-like protein|nr:bifunctional oligoribonuclease/PAP phosphatase NrnA [Bacillota bacterium]
MAKDNDLKKVAAALQEASRLLLLSHVSPDGDSLGSLLALRHALLRRGKQVWVYVEGGVPDRYRFLPGAEEVLTCPDQLPSETATVVVLDCGEWERVGLPAQRFAAHTVVNIDHHRTSKGLGQANYLDSSAAATGLMLLRLLSYCQEEIDQVLATCLYTAIAGDTGFFRYSNTTAEVHQAAASLLAAGAKQNLVYENLETRSFSYLKALGLVLERLETFASGQGAYSYLTSADLERLGIPVADTDGFVNYPRSLTGVQVAAFFIEVETDTYKVSLRSREPLDVSAVAAILGGGGHARAAGCTMQGSIEECIRRLKEAIHEVGQRT